MTTTFAMILGLFTTGSAPMGLMGGAIALIVGLNFWAESRDALETDGTTKDLGRISGEPPIQGLPLATSHR